MTEETQWGVRKSSGKITQYDSREAAEAVVERMNKLGPQPRWTVVKRVIHCELWVNA